MLNTVIVIAAIGGMFALILTIADKKLHVPVDERKGMVLELLPGANCGACGSPGCEAFAAAIVDLGINISYCVACSEENKRQIAQIIGLETEVSERKTASVACRGCENPAADIYEYKGIKDCFAAAKFFSGSKACKYTCLGLGSCANSCPFGAISINDRGVAEIDSSRCAGCSVCVQHCPQQLISIIPETANVRVFCNNRDMGKKALSVCNTACISCSACVRACPSAAINLHKDGSKSIAVIDYDKCTNCGLCISKCPTKCIAYLDKQEYVQQNIQQVSASCNGCIGCGSK